MKIKQYEERVFAFIDILGFNKKIKESESSPEAYKTILEAIDYFSETKANIEKLIIGRFKNSKLEIGIFSDSIALSAKKADLYSVMLKSMFITIALLNRGLPCRGAIAIGKGVHEGNIIFGPGFVDVYELESTASIYPRIILSHEAAEIYKTSRGNKPISPYYIKQDNDGFWFLDIFSCPLPEGQRDKLTDSIKIMITRELAKLDKDGKSSIIGKYRWLENQVNQYETQAISKVNNRWRNTS